MALSFFFALLIYNLCRFTAVFSPFVWRRSREDKMRVKTGNAMIDNLGSEDLKALSFWRLELLLEALEEFYERMPLEARPQRNGEADAGDLPLAQRLRAWCVQRDTNCGAAVVVSKLCRLKGSVETKALVAQSLRLICQEQQLRRFVVASHGLRRLLELAAEEKAAEPAKQALAQLLISTNPTLLQRLAVEREIYLILYI